MHLDERHSSNSDRRPIAATPSAVSAFWSWYGESKVLAPACGSPVMLYHGTTEDIAQFKIKSRTSKDAGWYGQGIYFTADPNTASAYAKYEELQSGQLIGFPNVIPVYVRVINPYIWPEGKAAFLTYEESAAFTVELKERGFDGIIVPNEYADPLYAPFYEVIAFSPNQIKSAIGNPGTFNNADERLTDDLDPMRFHSGADVMPAPDSDENDSRPRPIRPR